MAAHSSLDLAKANYAAACEALKSIEVKLHRFRRLVRDFAAPLHDFLEEEDTTALPSLSRLGQSLTVSVKEITSLFHEIRAQATAARHSIALCLQNLNSAHGNAETLSELRLFCETVIDGINVVELAVLDTQRNLEAEANSIMELALKFDLPSEVVTATTEILQRAAWQGARRRMR